VKKPITGAPFDVLALSRSLVPADGPAVKGLQPLGAARRTVFE
jgi:hypothetical protein